VLVHSYHKARILFRIRLSFVRSALKLFYELYTFCYENHQLDLKHETVRVECMRDLKDIMDQ
jgi:hypothetical protein